MASEPSAAAVRASIERGTVFGTDIPAWKRRRYDRLGIPYELPRPKPSQTVSEHSASASDLRAIAEAEQATRERGA